MFKKYSIDFIIKIVLMILFSWLLMTILVDIYVVPPVFRNISSRVEAGRLGGIIFQSFNIIEVIFSAIILILSLCLGLRLKSGIRKKLILLFSLFLLGLSNLYFLKMTPEIIKLNTERHQALSQDLVTQLEIIEEKHQAVHHLYVKLDSAKMLLLLVFLVLVFPLKNGHWALINDEGDR